MIFPRQSVPESKKNEQWHRDCILATINYHYDYGVFRNENIKDNENYQLVDGIFDHKQFEYITDVYGITAPARLVNWPVIGPRLELLAGELLSQGLEWTVNVTNRNAIARKNERKIGVAVETLLRPIRREMEQLLGVPMEDEDVGEEIPKDIEEFSNMKFRDAVEVNVNVGLKFLVQKYSLDHIFKRGFYDLSICSKEFYKVYVKNGDPYVERIDPRNMIWDKDSESEFIQHASLAGHKRYYAINEILDRFKLTKEQVELLEDLSTRDRSYFDDLGLGFEFYRFDDGGVLSVCVTELQWRSIKMMKYKVSKNPYDEETPFYKMMDDDYEGKKGEDIREFGTSDVRKAILIGHELLIDWGRKPNQYRPEENYQHTTLDYYGCIKNNFTSVTLSPVDALKNVQLMTNVVWYHIEKALAASGGKSVVYDVSQKPEKIPLEDVFYHAKNSGLILINSKQEGNKYGGNGFNQFQSVDFTLSNSVQQLMNLLGLLNDTADRMTGISAARSGINKSGDLVGVNERNVMQSTLITAPLYEIHYKVVGDVLQACANIMPFCWGNEGRMVNIFGDTGMETFHIDKSIAKDEYGIFVKNNAKELSDKRTMAGLIMQYANSGAIDPASAIRSVRAGSATEIENIISNGLKQVQAQQTQIEQQKNELIKQSNELTAQANELKKYDIDTDSKTKIEVAHIMSEGRAISNDQLMRGAKETTDMKNRTKIEETNLKIQSEREKLMDTKSKPAPAKKAPSKSSAKK
jgi:hypothetical protein